MEGGTEQHLPKTDDWCRRVHRWASWRCRDETKKWESLNYSTADEEHSVFIRKLQLLYIFFTFSFHLYVLTTLTCGPDNAESQSLVSAALSPPLLFCVDNIEYDESGTYSRTCHKHCRIATTGARCFGESITGWHLTPLWPFSCENTCLRCCQRGHTILMWLFGHPLLWQCVSIGLNLLSYHHHQCVLPKGRSFTARAGT